MATAACGHAIMERTQLKSELALRFATVEERILAACHRAGRARADVSLVAVTKTVAAEIAALVPELGVLDLGESRPQELWKKAAAVPAARWHLVGHLQRNKIERTLPLVHMIHSVDSLRLLRALDQEASKQGRTVEVLLEVNASREEAKHGFAPEELATFWADLAAFQHARITGLMTMAAFEENPERCRPTFRLLRELCERLRGETPPPHQLAHLSMGMTHDFEVAVEEGATWVRVGTALFEG